MTMVVSSSTINFLRLKNSMKHFPFLIALFTSIFFSFFTSQSQTSNTWQNNLTRIYSLADGQEFTIVQDCNLYAEGWDLLPQPKFWCKVMGMEKDSSLINIAATRELLGFAATSHIDTLEEEELDAFKDSVRQIYNLDKEEKVYVTSGKSDYYQFHQVLPTIHYGIEAFQAKGVDPWYAQAILLIESPGLSRTSINGARGPFQLMKSVAIAQGLRVNSKVDERDDIDKAASAAAGLIHEVCIPRAKQILDAHNISYSEEEIWFKLMVLHVYHAGYRNVRDVMLHLKPKKGGISLIRSLWQTQYRRFGNASQNYSQLVLASMIRLDQIVLNEFEIRCDCCD